MSDERESKEEAGKLPKLRKGYLILAGILALVLFAVIQAVSGEEVFTQVLDVILGLEDRNDG